MALHEMLLLSAQSSKTYLLVNTCVKISQAITGLLAQQPHNCTVNMIDRLTVLFNLVSKYCLLQLGESTGFVRVYQNMQNPTWYNNQVHGCSIAVQSCHLIIPWQHVLSCMDMAVDLLWWFKQRCSRLFVHQAMNSLFQHRHVEACQQHCSSSPAQPCIVQACMSSGKNKLCAFLLPV